MSTMPSFFKNYSLTELTYLEITLNTRKSYLGSTKKIDNKRTLLLDPPVSTFIK